MIETGPRILIVEDESLLAEEMRDRLERMNYQVVAIADTAAAAMDSAFRHKPDLILMDIRLKGSMHGVDAADAIYRDLGIPSVFVTAHSDSGTIARARRSGQFGYVLKPFEEGALHAAIEMALERNQLDSDLRAAQILQAAMIQCASDAIVGKDLNGTVISWNPAAETLFGYRADEAIGKPFDPQRHKDGSILDVWIKTAPVRNARGKVTGTVHIARDVSERKKLEEELRESQKMEGLGRLAGGIAHDFNNLLTVINGYSAVIMRGLGKTDPLRERMAAIVSAGENAAELVSQLLTFGRCQQTQPQLIDLKELLSRYLPVLKSAAGARVVLTMDLTMDPTMDLAADLTADRKPSSPVLADAVQLRRVIMNLVVNARDAMPGGGRIAIRLADAGDFVVISVTDTGAGVAPEIVSRIFDPFFTTKTGQDGSGEKGSGLGLAIAYAAVKQAGGTIRVASPPGYGATFSVHLPRAATAAGVADSSAAQCDRVSQSSKQAAAPEAQCRPAKGSPAARCGGVSQSSKQAAAPDPQCRPGNGPAAQEQAVPAVTARQAKATVLLVEDRADVRGFVKCTLNDIGYDVLEAESGEQALKRAELFAGPIDLMLTDVVMPAMTGVELADRIRASRPAIRTLFMSGYAAQPSGSSVLLDPDAPRISKPFTSAALAAKLRELLG